MNRRIKIGGETFRRGVDLPEALEPAACGELCLTFQCSFFTKHCAFAGFCAHCVLDAINPLDDVSLAFVLHASCPAAFLVNRNSVLQTNFNQFDRSDSSELCALHQLHGFFRVVHGAQLLSLFLALLYPRGRRMSIRILHGFYVQNMHISPMHIFAFSLFPGR